MKYSTGAQLNKKEQKKSYDRKQGKQYYLKNKEIINKKHKEYNLKHKEERKVYIEDYRVKNKERIKLSNRKYRLNNKEKEKNRGEKYRLEHKEKVRLNARDYDLKNRDKKNKRALERKKIDINVKIACALRTRINMAVRLDQKSGSAVKDLGCSVEFFKGYITGLFVAGMTWENYGKWHLDHIKPLALYDLKNRAEFLKACYYTNYQPLWAYDNLSKGAKYIINY